MKSSSQRQGRSREVGSEGSRRQTREATYRNAVQGPVPGASQHNVAKPAGSGDTVDGALVRGRWLFLCGETCPVRRALGRPALTTVTSRANGQESAEGVVATRHEPEVAGSPCAGHGESVRRSHLSRRPELARRKRTRLLTSRICAVRRSAEWRETGVSVIGIIGRLPSRTAIHYPTTVW